MKQVLIYNDDGSSLAILAKATGSSVIASGLFVQTLPAITKNIVKLGTTTYVSGVTAADWAKIGKLDKMYDDATHTVYLSMLEE